MIDLSTALWRVGRYIDWRSKRQNRHDIQAPYLYAIADTVFRNSETNSYWKSIEQIRREGLVNDKPIRLSDFGAGFSGKKYESRPLSFIMKHSASDAVAGQFLSRLFAFFKPERALELGSSLGIGTLYQCSGYPKAEMISIEGCPETAREAGLNYSRFSDFTIRSLVGPFDRVLPGLREEGLTFEWVSIDGHHEYEATLNYFAAIQSMLASRALVIIDDITWSKGMWRAWNEIKEDESFAISLDVYDMGILIRRPGLSKEHFRLSYR